MRICLKQRILPLVLCLCMLWVTCAAFAPIPAMAKTEVAPAISVGNGFMVALASDGTAYAWGSNSFGMLGDGTKTSSNTPVKVLMPNGVRFAAVSAGWNHVVALSTDGKIYTWGSNAYGQLGTDDVDAVLSPTPIQFHPTEKIVAVEAGNSFSLALTEEGTVYAWGSNTKGELGVPCEELTHTEIPRKIETLSQVTVTSIHAGSATAAAIGADGKVWLWGDNSDGQCGASSGMVVLPMQKNASTSYFAVDVALGEHHTSLLELNGSIKGFGTNLYGQFGNGQEVSDLKYMKMVGAILPEGVVSHRIAAGEGHCVMIDAKGEVYSFGDNRKGQLGLPDKGVASLLPWKVDVPMGSAKAISLDACGSTTAIVDSEGLIWTWGDNSQGQLGIGSFTDSALPVGVVDANGERLSLGTSSHTMVYQSLITVNATVPPPSFSIEIPAGISVGELKRCDPKEDQSHIVAKPITVTASDVDHLFGEKRILVTVNTASGKFELADGDYRLPYTVYGALDESPLEPGDPFTIFTENGNAEGKITFDQSLITREGSYSGRLTFSIRVEDIPAEE